MIIIKREENAAGQRTVALNRMDHAREIPITRKGPAVGRDDPIIVSPLVLKILTQTRSGHSERNLLVCRRIVVVRIRRRKVNT